MESIKNFFLSIDAGSPSLRGSRRSLACIGCGLVVRQGMEGGVCPSCRNKSSKALERKERAAKRLNKRKAHVSKNRKVEKEDDAVEEDNKDKVAGEHDIDSGVEDDALSNAMEVEEQVEPKAVVEVEVKEKSTEPELEPEPVEEIQNEIVEPKRIKEMVTKAEVEVEKEEKAKEKKADACRECGLIKKRGMVEGVCTACQNKLKKETKKTRTSEAEEIAAADKEPEVIAEAESGVSAYEKISEIFTEVESEITVDEPAAKEAIEQEPIPAKKALPKGACLSCGIVKKRGILKEVCTACRNKTEKEEPVGTKIQQKIVTVEEEPMAGDVTEDMATKEVMAEPEVSQEEPVVAAEESQEVTADKAKVANEEPTVAVEELVVEIIEEEPKPAKKALTKGACSLCGIVKKRGMLEGVCIACRNKEVKEKSVEPEIQPEVATVQEESVIVAIEEEANAEEPMAVDEPEKNTEEQSFSESEAMEQESVEDTPFVASESKVISEEPVVVTEAPEVTAEESALVTEAPEVNAEESFVATEAQMVTIEDPAVAIEAPEVTAEEHVAATEASDVTIVEPVVVTEASEVTTKEPNVSTKEDIVEESEIMVTEEPEPAKKASLKVACSSCGIVKKRGMVKGVCTACRNKAEKEKLIEPEIQPEAVAVREEPAVAAELLADVTVDEKAENAMEIEEEKTEVADDEVSFKNNLSEGVCKYCVIVKKRGMVDGVCLACRNKAKKIVKRPEELTGAEKTEFATKKQSDSPEKSEIAAEEPAIVAEESEVVVGEIDAVDEEQGAGPKEPHAEPEVPVVLSEVTVAETEVTVQEIDAEQEVGTEETEAEPEESVDKSEVSVDEQQKVVTEEPVTIEESMFDLSVPVEESEAVPNTFPSTLTADYVEELKTKNQNGNMTQKEFFHVFLLSAEKSGILGKELKSIGERLVVAEKRIENIAESATLQTDKQTETVETRVEDTEDTEDEDISNVLDQMDEETTVRVSSLSSRKRLRASNSSSSKSSKIASRGSPGAKSRRVQ